MNLRKLRVRQTALVSIGLLLLGCTSEDDSHSTVQLRADEPGTIATFAGETNFREISELSGPRPRRRASSRQLSYLHQVEGAIGRRLCRELETGDYVDLNFLFPVTSLEETPPKPRGYLSMDLVQRVPVLATHSNAEGCDVELQTKSEEFINLTVAGSRGQGHILLREPDNPNVQPVARTTLVDAVRELDREIGDVDHYGLPLSSFKISDRDLQAESLNLVARVPELGVFPIANDVKIGKFHREVELFGLESVIVWLPKHLAEATMLFRTTNAVLEFTTERYEIPDLPSGEFISKTELSVGAPAANLASVDENGTIHIPEGHPLDGELKPGDGLHLRKLLPPKSQVSAPVSIHVVSVENGIEPAELIAPGENFVVSFGANQLGPYGLVDAIKDLEAMSETRNELLRLKAKSSFRDYWFDTKTPVLGPGDTIDVIARYRTGPKRSGAVAMNILQTISVTGRRQVNGQNQIKLSLMEDEYLLMRLSQHRGAVFEFGRQLRRSPSITTVRRQTLAWMLMDLELIHSPRFKRRKKASKKRASGTPRVSPMSRGLSRGSSQPEAVSTFSIDVDTTSFSLAKEVLKKGAVPTIRTEEFINAFEYNYPEPKEEEDFGLVVDGTNSPLTYDKNTKLIRLAIQAPRLHERDPVQMVFVVDTSGSMQGVQRIGLVKKTLAEIAKRMVPGDTISIVTFDSEAKVRLPPTGVDERNRILSEIASLDAHGATALEEGIRKAYEIASRYQTSDAQSRVVVASDGDGNIGNTDGTRFMKLVSHHRDKEIFLTILGFGSLNLEDSRLERISNSGNGNYHYVGDHNDIDRLISKTLFGTIQAVAKDVKLQVSFDPTKVKTHRLIGYENRLLAEQEFTNDSVDAGELGSGLAVTALYEVELFAGVSGNIGRVDTRHKRIGESESRHQTFQIDMNRFHRDYAKTPESFRLATGVAIFAEFMRNPEIAKTINLAAVYDSLVEIQTTSQEDELVEMIEQFASLQK